MAEVFPNHVAHQRLRSHVLQLWQVACPTRCPILRVYRKMCRAGKGGNKRHASLQRGKDRVRGCIVEVGAHLVRLTWMSRVSAAFLFIGRDQAKTIMA